jgi:hypothetical protein
MAKVTGPLMSLSASGSVGKTITFATWKGRPYVRQLVTPTNPKSALQTGTRAMFAFLTAAWSALAAGAKSSWDELATATQISAFNAYVGSNLTRWQSFLAPTVAYPAAEASTPLTITTMTCTGNAGYATVEITPSGSTNLSAFAVFRDDAEITTPGWANCVAVVPADGADPVLFTDSPLTAGTYHYRVAALNDDGIMGTVKADATATVT